MAKCNESSITTTMKKLPTLVKHYYTMWELSDVNNSALT